MKHISWQLRRFRRRHGPPESGGGVTLSTRTVWRRLRAALALAEARRALRRYDWDIAIEASTAAIRQAPDAAIVCTPRAVAQFQFGHIRATIADCSKALTRDPAATPFYWLRGKAHLRQCKYRKATDDFTSALLRDPTSIDAHLLRGAAYIQLAAWDEAIIDLSSAVLRGQCRQTAYLLRGISLSGIGKVKRALADFLAAAEFDPTDTRACAQRAICNRALGDVNRARRDQRRADRLLSQRRQRR